MRRLVWQLLVLVPLLAISAVSESKIQCPEICACRSRQQHGTSTGLHQDIVSDCSYRQLTTVPEGLSDETTILNLKFNQLASLDCDSLRSVDFLSLQEVVLTGNQLTELATPLLASWTSLLRVVLDYNPLHQLPDDFLSSSTNMKALSCKGCGLTSFPKDALRSMRYLQELDLSWNALSVLEADALKDNIFLSKLELENCGMTEFPREALRMVPELKKLYLDHNEISELQEHDFDSLPVLVFLSMSHNNLTFLPARIFANLVNLRYLSLDDNPIERFGYRSSSYIFDDLLNIHVLSLKRLKLSTEVGMLKNNNRIFWKLRQMIELHLDGNKEDSPGFLALLYFHQNSIRRLYWSGHTFTRLDYIGDTCLLESLQMPRGPMKTLSWSDGGLCGRCNKLKEIDMSTNALQMIDPLQGCTQLTQLYLQRNDLTTEAVQSAVANHPMLMDLILSYNSVKSLNEFTLGNMSNLERLDLSYNALEYIHPRAFINTPKLERLYLNGTRFPAFPQLGLSRLIHLEIADGAIELHEFPPASNYPACKVLTTQYRFHCCRWQEWNSCESQSEDSVGFPRNHSNNTYTYESDEDDPLPPGFFDVPLSEADQRRFNDTWANASVARPPKAVFTGKVCCRPHPNGLTPCFDLLGETWLRILVWIVIIMSVLGNAIVLLVVGLSKERSMQTRSLVLSLAAGDLSMGIYMLVLGIVDAQTKGEFSQHAVAWKEGAACKAIGFLAIFSSLMSVFSLTLITLERYVTIIYAMRRVALDSRRLKRILLIGWFAVILLALLPIFGVNSYSEYVVCLPMATRSVGDIIYIAAVLGVTAVSFLLIIICYIRIYITVHNSPAQSKTDYQIALRMAILIFIDLCCWSPIWFLSFHALATNRPYISLQQAKYFIVLIFPLNSCANPFLYAILTRNFQRDLVKMAASVPAALQRRASFMSPSGLSDKSLKDVMVQLQHEARSNTRKAVTSPGSDANADTLPSISPVRIQRYPSQINSSSGSSVERGPITYTIDVLESGDVVQVHGQDSCPLPYTGVELPNLSPPARAPGGDLPLHGASSGEETSTAAPSRALAMSKEAASSKAGAGTARKSSTSSEAHKTVTRPPNRTFLSPLTHDESCSISQAIKRMEDQWLARKESRQRRSRERHQELSMSKVTRPRDLALGGASVAAAAAALSGLVPMLVAHGDTLASPRTAGSSPRPPPLTEKEMEGDRCSVVGEHAAEGDDGEKIVCESSRVTSDGGHAPLPLPLRNLYVTSL